MSELGDSGEHHGSWASCFVNAPLCNAAVLWTIVVQSFWCCILSGAGHLSAVLCTIIVKWDCILSGAGRCWTSFHSYPRFHVPLINTPLTRREHCVTGTFHYKGNSILCQAPKSFTILKSDWSVVVFFVQCLCSNYEIKFLGFLWEYFTFVFRSASEGEISTIPLTKVCFFTSTFRIPVLIYVRQVRVNCLLNLVDMEKVLTVNYDCLSFWFLLSVYFCTELTLYKSVQLEPNLLAVYDHHVRLLNKWVKKNFAFDDNGILAMLL